MAQNGGNLQLNGATHKESEVNTGDSGGGGGGFMDTLLGAPELLKQKRRPEDLASLTREELIERVLGLEKHVQQLRNVIAKEGSLHTITRDTEMFFFGKLEYVAHLWCLRYVCNRTLRVAVSKRPRYKLAIHLPVTEMYA
jgi:hypothetical protein